MNDIRYLLTNIYETKDNLAENLFPEAGNSDECLGQFAFMKRSGVSCK